MQIAAAVVGAAAAAQVVAPEPWFRVEVTRGEEVEVFYARHVEHEGNRLRLVRGFSVEGGWDFNTASIALNGGWFSQRGATAEELAQVPYGGR
jgi:hypothetical protein